MPVERAWSAEDGPTQATTATGRDEVAVARPADTHVAGHEQPQDRDDRGSQGRGSAEVPASASPAAFPD